MRTIIISEPTMSVVIGRPGENEATLIKFPIAHWLEDFGNAGTFALTHKRQTDEGSYPCVVTADDEYVSWVINSADVAVTGNGKAVLYYTIDGQIVKSKTYITVTMETVETEIEPPEPYEPWIDQLLSTTAENAKSAEAYAIGTRNGEPVPDTDPAYHNNSKYFAENARNLIIVEICNYNPSSGWLGPKYTADEIHNMYNTDGCVLFWRGNIVYFEAMTGFSEETKTANLYYFYSGIGARKVNIKNDKTYSTDSSFIQNRFTTENYTLAEKSKLAGINPGVIEEGNDGYTRGGDVYNALHNLPGIVQPDWEETDPTSSAYIKNKLQHGSVASGNTGYTTGDDVYNALAGIEAKFIEITLTATVSKYTGKEVALMWQSGVLLRCRGGIVLEVKNSTTTGYKLIVYVSTRGTDTLGACYGIEIENDGTTMQTPSDRGTMLSINQRYKLDEISTGTIESGSTGYTTGDSVYRALAFKQEKLTDGTNAKDILYWDTSINKYVTGPITDVIANGDEVSY